MQHVRTKICLGLGLGLHILSQKYLGQILEIKTDPEPP